MIRQRVTFTALSLLAILPAAPDLAAQRVIDLPGRDQPLDADFEEIFRVGVIDGEDWEMFADVHTVAFDADGSLYVIDGLEAGAGARVLVFDASGDFVLEFGSPGEGPGEFNRPVGFVVMRDGTTVVGDRGHHAYQLFDADGRFLRMVRGHVVRGTMLPDPRGGGVFRHSDNRTISVGGPGGGTAPSPPTSRPVVRMDLGGDELQADTVVEAWLPPRGADGFDLDWVVPPGSEAPRNVDAQVRRAVAGSMAPGPVFEPPLLVGVLSDGSVVHSDSSAYALRVTPPGADEAARVIRRPLPPKPVTREMENDYRSTRYQPVLPRATGANSSQSRPAFILQAPERDFHPELSVLRDLATTWEDRIWVRRRGDEWLAAGPIDVVTADGRYVGTFATDATRMPDAFGPDGMAAFVVRDEFGVASVVVRRLSGGVR